MNNYEEECLKLNRREVLKSALKLGAASAGAAALSGLSAHTLADTGTEQDYAALVSGYGNFRVDVHCHHIPDFYRASLAENGIFTAGGVPIPPWSPELAVNFMNDYSIRTQIVSISEPGVTYLSSAPERILMARKINDYTVDTLMNSSDSSLQGRFGGFAVLPMQSPENGEDILSSCAEAVRAIQGLGMDGIGIFSNYDGIYLGDPRFEPLMATLNELEAMVFVHPVTPVKPENIKLPTFLFEFPFDTTRAAVNMLYHGVYKRYPKIRWLLAHAGGTLPYLQNLKIQDNCTNLTKG